jgi:hypothetical protein
MRTYKKAVRWLSFSVFLISSILAAYLGFVSEFYLGRYYNILVSVGCVSISLVSLLSRKYGLVVSTNALIAYLGIILLQVLFVNLEAERSYKVKKIKEMRKKGIKAYPNLHSQNFLWKDARKEYKTRTIQRLLQNEYLEPPKAKGKEYIPLGTLGDTYTVYCKEDDSELAYWSDKYGFNNPDETLARMRDESGNEIALVGDSFVEGACVSNENHFAGLLRQEGYEVLNLGRGGNGPILNYASLVEYASYYEPDIVLWFYYPGNDIVRINKSGQYVEWPSDVQVEYSSRIVKKYLKNKGFDQGLKNVKREIDENLKRRLESEIKDRVSSLENEKKYELEKVVQVMTAEALVKRMKNLVENVSFSSGNQKSPSEVFSERNVGEALRNTKKSLKLSKKKVSGWGGEMLMVYLPSMNVCKGKAEKNPVRGEVMEMTKDLSIGVIDIAKNMYRGGCKKYFAKNGVHLNEKGYKKVFRTVKQRTKDKFKSE